MILSSMLVSKQEEIDHFHADVLLSKKTLAEHASDNIMICVQPHVRRRPCGHISACFRNSTFAIAHVGF